MIIDLSTKHSQKQPYEFSKENTLSTRFSISHRFSRRNAVRHHPYFGSDALSGGSQISLLATTGMCVFIGMAFYRIPWKDYELAITNNISGVATAIIILLIIGALSGTWMISGVVPTLIYYGMQIIHPNFFLASTCIICALVSVMTGSSWTTIATIGIALLGIGKAQGFEEGWIAGAIISGAYFGDKFHRYRIPQSLPHP